MERVVDLDEAVFKLVKSLAVSVGLIGNFLTCFVIIKNRSLRTAANFYLLNLSASDLTILLLNSILFSMSNDIAMYIR